MFYASNKFDKYMDLFVYKKYHPIQFQEKQDLNFHGLAYWTLLSTVLRVDLKWSTLKYCPSLKIIKNISSSTYVYLTNKKL